MRPHFEPIALDDVDRRIVNALQGGFPLVSRPYAAVAETLGIDEDDLIARLARLIETGALSRFAPMFDAEKIGGAVCLAAMDVPAHRFEAVAETLAAMPEIAHNYERDHRLNMWFVIATERPEGIGATQRRIERATGSKVLLFPKAREFFIGMRVDV